MIAFLARWLNRKAAERLSAQAHRNERDRRERMTADLAAFAASKGFVSRRAHLKLEG